MSDNPVQTEIALHRRDRLIASAIRFAWILTSVLILIGALIVTWKQRYSIPEGDGLNYVEMASKAAHGGISDLISTYWGSGYPALLAIAFALFRTEIPTELPVVHAVNLLVFLISAGCLAWFVREWLSVNESPARDASRLPAPVWPFVGAILFGWITAFVTAIYLVTPDLAVTCVVLATAALCCRIERRPRLLYWIALGVVLGVGAYFKTAVVPIGFLLFAIFVIWPPDNGRVRYGRVTAVAAFVVVLAPLVALTSSKAHHFSIGESGGLNYLWYVNGGYPWNPWGIWTGEVVNGTRAIHPARVLVHQPFVMEFAEPIHSTYPLWYDPYYWSEGVKARPNLQDQMKTFANIPRLLFEHITGPTWLIGALIWLFGILSLRRHRIDSGVVRPWVILWPVGMLLMYLAVHIEDRFFGGFLLIWLIGGLTLLSRVSIRAFLCGFLLLGASMALPLIPQAASGTGRFTRLNPKTGRDTMLMVGQSLLKAGVRPGDKMATCGNSFNSYWARAAGVRVVAQIVKCAEPGGLDATNAGAVVQKLNEIGVAGVVAADVPADFAGLSWIELGRTRHGSFHFASVRPRN